VKISSCWNTCPKQWSMILSGNIRVSPLIKSHLHLIIQNSHFMLQIEWENGVLTVDLSLNARDNPATFEILANDNCMLVNIDEEKDYIFLHDPKDGFSYSLYGENDKIIPSPDEIIPQDTLPRFGMFVIPSQNDKAKLMLHIMSGRSVYEILHMVNKTPPDWMANNQAKE
jgi:hypothetical protein